MPVSTDIITKNHSIFRKNLFKKSALKINLKKFKKSVDIENEIWYITYAQWELQQEMIFEN